MASRVGAEEYPALSGGLENKSILTAATEKLMSQSGADADHRPNQNTGTY